MIVRGRINDVICKNPPNKRRTGFTEEHLRNLSKALKGRTYLEETKQKMAMAKKGRTLPEGVKKKLSESGKRDWIRRKLRDKNV
jgi:hypothetical protein